jgi:hypothetical protein
MKSMKDVWTSAIAVAVAGAVFWWAAWTSMGEDMASGALGNEALGFWGIFTGRGDYVWLPGLLLALVAGGIAFGVGRSSYQARQQREAKDAADAAATADRPHPLD